jgi:hypothetical protein
MKQVWCLILFSWVIIHPTEGFCEKTKRVLQFQLTDDQFIHSEKPPLRLKVQQNDQIEWQIKSNQPGELHLHAYGIEVRVPKNQLVVYKFDAKATGKFQIEWHPQNNPSSTPPKSNHSAQAYLEVYPK